MMNNEKIRELLAVLYGQDASGAVHENLKQLLEDFEVRSQASHAGGVDQRDTILIAYPDHVQDEGRPPLAVLAEFCRAHLSNAITGIHILPFYPWTSDDGFSVVDYKQVDPRYGDWNDIELLGRDFKLMFDAVINHISVESGWFQSMLAGSERYRNYFVVPKEGDDLSRVVRPRALPLLTAFQTPQGEKRVWTTFSADQVDLNYANPAVLLGVLETLLFYVARGAEFIRLDAIADLWKEAGTSSIHLPQTHAIIQLFRAILDLVAPHVMLITETNVPHLDNISYFGNGRNEAHMVYNFSLPPLVLHAFYSGSADNLTRWADGLDIPAGATFFNFLASHDGIGLNPLRGILPEQEIESVVERVRSHGGLVSLKNETDGSQRPYELNVNYFDALNDPFAAEPIQTQVDRFVTAHAILLALRGLPAIYFHSLAGSRGWPDGARATGHNRTINRQKLLWSELESALSDSTTLRAKVFRSLERLLMIRHGHPAFHPYGSQAVVSCAAEVFGLLRISPDGNEQVLCLQNVSNQEVKLEGLHSFQHWTHDLIEDKWRDKPASIALKPYQTLWLIEPKD